MRSVARVLGGIVAMGLLTGCGGTWQKAGAGAAEFDRDWAYCLASTPQIPEPPRPASMSLPVSPLSAEATNETRYREYTQSLALLRFDIQHHCMQARGWRMTYSG